jgi:hypothetical protein
MNENIQQFNNQMIENKYSIAIQQALLEFYLWENKYYKSACLEAK